MSGIEYVYGVVANTCPLGTPPPGIDDQRVRSVEENGLIALVSTLDGDMYRPTAIEHGVIDVEWLTPRAVAHDRIVTWASDRGAVIPLPMWTLFSDEHAVQLVLRTRGDLLHANLATIRDSREYTVRVFADLAMVTLSAASLSPRLAELEHSVAAASPGQAYLIRRKLDAERKTEVRHIARQVVDDTYTTLHAYATQAVQDPLPQGEHAGSAILNASFLVRSDQYDPFRKSLTTLITKYQSAGFHFDFTGPWPTYHFVRVS